MNVILFFILIALFVVMTPGAVFTVPVKCSKWCLLAIHGFLFATIWTLTHKFLWRATSGILPPIRMFEGLTPKKAGAPASA